MAVYLADVRTALAIELGEDSVSSAWPSYRDSCIQWGLERISRYYDFDFGKVTVSLTTGSDGTIALTAATYRTDPSLDVRVVVAGSYNDHIFEAVAREDFDNYGQGDYRYYLSTDAAGAQTLVTTEPSTTLSVTGDRLAPVISAAVPSNFPSALVIAKAALVYVREYEDKDADVSVEDAKFRQAMQEIIGAEQRSHGPRRAKSRMEIMGLYTGMVGGDRYY